MPCPRLLTSVQSLPNEILLSIFQDIFEQAEEHPLDPIFPQRSIEGADLVSIQSRRLACFRRIAGVCRHWAKLSRTIFWMKVMLGRFDTELEGSQLDLLLHALRGNFAVHSSIREFRFYLPDRPYSSQCRSDEPEEKRVLIAERTVPSVLAFLPDHLDTMELNCIHHDTKLRVVLFEALERMETKKVQTLLAGCRPDGRDTSLFFGRFQNVTHLRIALEPRDQAGTFPSGLAGMTLYSLHVDIDLYYFSHEAKYADWTNDYAKPFVEALRPACAELQELVLTYNDWDDPDPNGYVSPLGIILSIGCSTVVNLQFNNLSFQPRPPIIQGLTDGHALSKFPSLRHLFLNDVGVNPDVFEQMICHNLQTLKIAVVGIDVTSESETQHSILRSLDLPVLSALEDVYVRFGKIDPNLGGQTWEFAQGIWREVGEACRGRGIRFRLFYPNENRALDTGVLGRPLSD